MKKGFTLIELLAVIVILAIIALIAIPSITNIVEEARKGAAKNSVLGYIDAVEKQAAINLLNSDETDNIKAKTYTVGELTDKKVVVKGKTPTGTVTVNNKGEVTDYELFINNYKVSPTNGDPNKPSAEKNNTSQTAFNGTIDTSDVYSSANVKQLGLKGIVYMDPTDLSKSCNASNSVSTTLTKTGCMKFYIYDDSGDTYKMILDHNTTKVIEWATQADYVEAGGTESDFGSGNNNKGSVTALKQLNNDTQGWVGNTRLISADEIVSITNTASFDATPASGFYLDGSGSSKSKGANPYAWLYDYTKDCTKNGCDIDDCPASGCDLAVDNTEGYWTSTPTNGVPVLAWYISPSGDVSYTGVVARLAGVRPVIEISKSLLD